MARFLVAGFLVAGCLSSITLFRLWHLQAKNETLSFLKPRIEKKIVTDLDVLTFVEHFPSVKIFIDVKVIEPQNNQISKQVNGR